MAEPTHRAPPELIRHAFAAPAAARRTVSEASRVNSGVARGGRRVTHIRPPLLPEDQHYFLDQRPTLLLCTFLCYF